jgi:hypothetical protein
MGLRGARSDRALSARNQAGDLLAVEAIDRSGLLVRSDGAFVRIIEVTPPNPLILSAEERAVIAEGYGRLASRLRAGQSVQFYVQALPVRLAEVLADARAQVSFWAGEAPGSAGQARDLLSLSRWRLYAALQESLELHADEQAAVQVSYYLVCPFLPVRAGTGLVEQLRFRMGRLRAPLRRELKAHRRASRESLAFTEALRSELDALSLPSHLLNGEEVVQLLWSRFNPTLARRGRARATEILAEVDKPIELEQARDAARRLRGLIGSSPIDFAGSPHHAEVDRDIEQTIYVAGTADSTRMGWLLGALLAREPFSLSVHVHALDRRRERQKLKMRYRRTFSVNRGAEARGRVPDFDRYAQEHEAQHLLNEMAGHDRAGLFELGIYESPRVRGPEADHAALVEAVDWCAEQIHSVSDATVNRGAYQQRELWPSTLPLGQDTAKRTCKYATRNVGDCVPLVGTGCGSPTGIPFAFSSPGRTLELLNPYDRAHNNSTLLVCGESGTGKTTATNKIIASCLAYGARAVYVIDRSGHYEILTQLVDGARQVQIGADSSPYAINPWDLSDASVVSREKVSFLLSLHSVMMGDEGLSALERAQLGAAIRDVYSTAAERGVSPRESLLREVLLARSEQELENGAVEIAAVLRNLADRIGEFCGQGAYSYLLDRETNVPEGSPLVVFDTRSCPEVVIGPVMFAIIEYVQRAIKHIRDQPPPQYADGQAPLFASLVVFVIEECWHPMANKDGGHYVNDMARRARHLGIVLVVVSQLLSDFAGEFGLALLRNCVQMLILKLAVPELSFAERELEFPSERAAIIRRLRTVKGAYSEIFWINGTRGQGKVTLRLGPTEYWCFTSEPLRDVPARDAAIAAHDGEVWPAIRELAASSGSRPAEPAA